MKNRRSRRAPARRLPTRARPTPSRPVEQFLADTRELYAGRAPAPDWCFAYLALLVWAGRAITPGAR